METVINVQDEPWTLEDEVRELEHSLERLREHRTAVMRAATGSVGSQNAAKMNARGRALSTAITDIEGAVFRLKDSLGLMAATPPFPSAAASPAQVSEGFEIRVTYLPVDGPAPIAETMMVWPQKPIVAVLNDAITLLGLTHLAGVWGIWKPGQPDPVQELSIHDARVQAGDVLQLRRVSSS